MSLLNNAQWSQFNKAIKEVTDTFFLLPVEIITRVRVAAVFNQSRKKTHQETIINANAIGIYDKNDQGAQNRKDNSGRFDLNEGYLLFNFSDLDGLGLIDENNVPKIIAHKDTVKFYGEEFEVNGINRVGPVKDPNKEVSKNSVYSLVKLHFQKTNPKNG